MGLSHSRSVNTLHRNEMASPNERQSGRKFTANRKFIWVFCCVNLNRRLPFCAEYLTIVHTQKYEFKK